MTQAPSQVFERGKHYASVGADDSRRGQWIETFGTPWVPLCGTADHPLIIEAPCGNPAYVIHVAGFNDDQLRSFTGYLRSIGEEAMLTAFRMQGYLVHVDGIIVVRSAKSTT